MSQLKDDHAFSLLHQEIPQILDYASLSTCCQNCEKNWGHQENLGETGVKILRDLTEKSVSFSTLATSNIRLLLFFGEEDQ